MAIPANVPTMAPLEINKFVTEPFNNVYWSKMFLKLTNDNTYKVKNDANARPKRQMKLSLKACLYPYASASLCWLFYFKSQLPTAI